MKFLLANLADFDHKNVPYENLLEIDRYALGVLHDLSVECRAAYNSYELHRVAQALQSFCAEDLGAFYLDILKDRLYTNAENSPDRRAAQTVLLKITQVLAGLMAPILSYTAEEIWQTLNTNTEDFVILHDWANADDVITPANHSDYTTLKPKWQAIRSDRARVLKKIELVRADGKLGSSLQAEIDIYAPEEVYKTLTSVGDDLRFVLIVSKVNVHLTDNRLEERIVVSPSQHKKCDRCWHYRADVGADQAHPQICGRCVSNLFGNGEPRKYA